MDFISEKTRHIKIYGIAGWSDLIEDRSLVYHQISGLWFYGSIGKGSLFQFISLFYSETIEKRLRVFQTESSLIEPIWIQYELTMSTRTSTFWLFLCLTKKKHNSKNSVTFQRWQNRINSIEFGSKYNSSSIVSLNDGQFK